MNVKEIFESMDYGPAPESGKSADDWLDSHSRKFDLFIKGSWQKPESGAYIKTVNPANRKALAQIAASDETDVSKAVDAADSSLAGWRGIGGHRRARYLYAIARQIQKHSRLFAVLESLDNGKPIRESRDIDIPLVARHFYHHAGWAQTMDKDLAGYQGVGVVGAITPWNFPLLIFAWKVAPALAMGNTVVIKPAQLTSLTAILFAEICETVGLPAGVFNLVTGSGTVAGTALAKHPKVAKITFTGSTEVGRILRKTIAGSGKKLTLELGGKSPYIVFDDADIDSAIEGLVDAIWFNQGQVCCAGSRLLVQENIEEKFIRKLKARMQKLRVGDPLDKAIDLGAIVDKKQLDTIERYVKIGIDEGGTCWQPDWEKPTGGFYCLPTLFTDVHPSSTIVIEEIFGPVLVALTFRTPAEAVKLANNTRYGLAASVWTENVNLALGVAPKLKAGTVWINCTNAFDAASGFGGYRESGFGREGGIEGLWDFVKPSWEAQYKKKPFELPTGPAAKKRPETGIDRTAKLYIGGKQARPDSGYSIVIDDPAGCRIGEVGEGNRKDIRNAVEAAGKASGWAGATGHLKAQILYYIAENLIQRKTEFAARIIQMTGVTGDIATREVDLSIERLYLYAAKADKYDGRVHATPVRNVTLAMPEPVGILGVGCPDEYPLLGFVSTVIPAVAMGNTVIAVPSEKHPLAATDLYQVFETSDLPGGVINIITGNKDSLIQVLANHDAVDGIWFWGKKDACGAIEEAAAANMKRTWLSGGLYRDWMNPDHGEGDEFLRKATEIKNIWVPYGE
jgi:aldehyde dehydrogenase (NAD+)